MNNTSSLNPKSQRQIQARVFLLDDSVHTFSINSYAIGSELFNAVIEKQGILEADYFDLEFVNCEGIRCWLDHDKSIVRQVGLGKDMIFIFAVKFYTPHPNLLEEEYTRYLFALQIKRDLVSGHLICSPNTAALLASYIVQAEIGDFLEDEYLDCAYLRHLKLVNQPNDEILNKVMEFHKNHVGITPSEADFHLLDTARKIEYYGVKMHLAKDHENLPLNLSVTHMGIVVFQNLTKINTFSWAKIRKLSFKRKKFLVKLHPEGYGYYKGMVEFYFETRDDCKRFWKKCIEHHAFFRCPATDKSNRKKPKVVTKGSSFRYSGKTQKELMEFVRENYTTRRDNFIRPSKARVSKSPHNPKSARNQTKTGHPFVLKSSYSAPSRAVSDGSDLHRTGRSTSTLPNMGNHTNPSGATMTAGHSMGASQFPVATPKPSSSRSRDRLDKSVVQSQTSNPTISPTTTTTPPNPTTTSHTPKKHHRHRASNPNVVSAASSHEMIKASSTKYSIPSGVEYNTQKSASSTTTRVDHHHHQQQYQQNQQQNAAPRAISSGSQKRARKGRKFIQVSHTGSSADEDDDKRVTASEMSLSSSGCWWANHNDHETPQMTDDIDAKKKSSTATRSSIKSKDSPPPCEEPLPAREAYEITHKEQIPSNAIVTATNVAIAAGRIGSLRPQRTSVGGIGDLSEDNNPLPTQQQNQKIKKENDRVVTPSSMKDESLRMSTNDDDDYDDEVLLEQPLGIKEDKKQQEQKKIEETDGVIEEMSTDIPYVLMRRHKSQSGASSLKSAAIKKHASKSLKSVRDAVDHSSYQHQNHPYSVSTITSGILAASSLGGGSKIRHSKSLDRRLAGMSSSDSHSTIHVPPKSPKLLREQYMHNQRKNILSDKETIEALKNQLRGYGSNKSLSRTGVSSLYDNQSTHPHYQTISTSVVTVTPSQQNGPMFVSAYRLPPINNFSAKDDTVSPGVVNNEFDKFYDRITKLAAENQKKRWQQQQESVKKMEQHQQQLNGTKNGAQDKKNNNVVDMSEDIGGSGGGGGGGVRDTGTGTGDLDSLLDLIPGNPVYLDSDSSSDDGEFSLGPNSHHPDDYDDRSSRRRPRSVSESEFRLRTPRSSRRSSVCRGANSSLSLTDDDELDSTSFNDSFCDDDDDGEGGSPYSFLADCSSQQNKVVNAAGANDSKNGDRSSDGCSPMKLSGDNLNDGEPFGTGSIVNNNDADERRRKEQLEKRGSTEESDVNGGAVLMDLQVLEIPKLSDCSSESDDARKDKEEQSKEELDSKEDQKEPNKTTTEGNVTTPSTIGTGPTSLAHFKQFSIRSDGNSEESPFRETSPSSSKSSSSSSLSIPADKKLEEKIDELNETNDIVVKEEVEEEMETEEEDEEEDEEEEEGEEYNANITNTLLPLDSIPEVAQEDKACTTTSTSPYSSKRSSQLTDEWDSSATPQAQQTPTIESVKPFEEQQQEQPIDENETLSDLEKKEKAGRTLEGLLQKRINQQQSNDNSNRELTNPFIRCSTPKDDSTGSTDKSVSKKDEDMKQYSASTNDITQDSSTHISTSAKSSSLTPTNPAASSSSSSSDAVKTVQSVPGMSSPYKSLPASLRRPYTSSSSSSSSSSSVSLSEPPQSSDHHKISSQIQTSPPDIIQISAHPKEKSENINLNSKMSSTAIQESIESNLLCADSTEESNDEEEEKDLIKEPDEDLNTTSSSSSGDTSKNIRESAKDMVNLALSCAQQKITYEEEKANDADDDGDDDDDDDEYVLPSEHQTTTMTTSSCCGDDDDDGGDGEAGAGTCTQSGDEVIHHEDAESFPPAPPSPTTPQQQEKTKENNVEIEANGKRESSVSSSTTATSSSASEGSEEIEPFPPPPPPPATGTSNDNLQDPSQTHLNGEDGRLRSGDEEMMIFDERDEDIFQGMMSEDSGTGANREVTSSTQEANETGNSRKISPPDLLSDTNMPKLPENEELPIPPFPEAPSLPPPETKPSVSDSSPLMDLVETVDQLLEQDFVNPSEEDDECGFKEEVQEEIIEPAIIPEHFGLLEEEQEVQEEIIEPAIIPEQSGLLEEENDEEVKQQEEPQLIPPILIGDNDDYLEDPITIEHDEIDALRLSYEDIFPDSVES